MVRVRRRRSSRLVYIGIIRRRIGGGVYTDFIVDAIAPPYSPFR